jgi:hypothetical protein
MVRVRPEQVSKLLRFIVGVGAASERVYCMVQFQPQKYAVFCIVGVAIVPEKQIVV